MKKNFVNLDHLFELIKKTISSLDFHISEEVYGIGSYHGKIHVIQFSSCPLSVGIHKSGYNCVNILFVPKTIAEIKLEKMIPDYVFYFRINFQKIIKTAEGKYDKADKSTPIKKKIEYEKFEKEVERYDKKLFCLDNTEVDFCIRTEMPNEKINLSKMEDSTFRIFVNAITKLFQIINDGHQPKMVG